MDDKLSGCIRLLRDAAETLGTFVPLVDEDDKDAMPLRWEGDDS